MVSAALDVQHGYSTIIYMLKLGITVCTLQCSEKQNVFQAAGVYQ